MARDETRDVFVLTEDGCPEMSDCCISVVEGTIRDEVASDGQAETRYVPHSDLADLERKLAEKEAESISAIKEMAKARSEKVEAQADLMLHQLLLYETANERGGQFKRLYDEWSRMKRQLADRDDAIQQLQEAMNELRNESDGLRALLVRVVKYSTEDEVKSRRATRFERLLGEITRALESKP